MNMELVSDDERRALYELGSGGNWKVMKYLVAKHDCNVGDHFHLKKDELFLLLSGLASVVLDDTVITLKSGQSLMVQRGQYHVFHLKSGSELICLASKVHDPSDDHKKS